jgi:hypothetical protein
LSVWFHVVWKSPRFGHKKLSDAIGAIIIVFGIAVSWASIIGFVIS